MSKQRPLLDRLGGNTNQVLKERDEQYQELADKMVEKYRQEKTASYDTSEKLENWLVLRLEKEGFTVEEMYHANKYDQWFRPIDGKYYHKISWNLKT